MVDANITEGTYQKCDIEKKRGGKSPGLQSEKISMKLHINALEETKSDKDSKSLSK